jgi:hypothetical protein
MGPPFAEQAIIDDVKLSNYLLSESHPYANGRNVNICWLAEVRRRSSKLQDDHTGTAASRSCLAAWTMFSSAGFTSSHRRVLRPQSGFTQS